MTTSLKFYSNSALTAELLTLSYTRAADGSLGADDRVVYLGSTSAGKTFTPVVGTEIALSVVDSNSGGGVPASAVTLATSQAGLATATPGAPLSLGASIASGAAGAKAIWIRVHTGALAIGDYADLSIETNNLQEA
ncbi:MAG: hypothetical protein D3M94_07440 [Rhodocyclales bacterium GT-UBC]|nr:MAG: hypothetical protein D3M94_07440 [Rhodocyclales bacterium GT-UBC]